MAPSIRRSGSTSVCITNTGSAGKPGSGIISTIARPAARSGRATQYEYPQGSACFIQSVDDTMEDIMRLAMSEAMLFKYGSGTGTDLSSLRSTREKLSGGGKPSGPLSFLKVYDQVANVVKSGGKTRRAAKMNTLKDWHPDIEEFIDAKQKEEKKAWALIEQGYDGSYNGDAYGSVMYQNENLTVRVSDEFMNAAVDGREWWTKRVRDGKPCEKKDARGIAAQDRGRHACLRRSRDAVRFHDPQMAHLQRHRPAELHQSVLGISLPR